MIRLTPEELKDVGRKLQQLEAKIKSTMEGEEVPVPPVDDLRAYAHCLKNTTRDINYSLIVICEKLEIPFASSRRTAKTDKKRLHDLSLFD